MRLALLLCCAMYHGTVCVWVCLGVFGCLPCCPASTSRRARACGISGPAVVLAVVLGGELVVVVVVVVVVVDGAAVQLRHSLFGAAAGGARVLAVAVFYQNVAQRLKRSTVASSHAVD